MRVLAPALVAKSTCVPGFRVCSPSVCIPICVSSSSHSRADDDRMHEVELGEIEVLASSVQMQFHLWEHNSTHKTGVGIDALVLVPKQPQ
jgi:hypothetical protein